MATKVIKSTKVKAFTMAEIMSAVVKSGQVNSAKGVKSFYTDNGAKSLARAVAKALALPTMSEFNITTDKGTTMAKSRRMFCKSHKATLLDGDIVLRKNTTDRTENAFHIRLRGVESVLGLPNETLYAVRATPYRKGEKSKVMVIRR